MSRKLKVTGILTLLLVATISYQALAAGTDNEQTQESQCIEYLGRSMRIIKQEDGAEDYDKTNIRFGYRFTLPEGVSIEDCTWGWKYTIDGKSPAEGNTREKSGDSTSLNYVKNDDGSYTTNLVITNIRSHYYRRDFYAQMFLKYSVNGVETQETDSVRVLNTKELAEAIQNSSENVPGDVAYAKGIADEIATYETMIVDKMHKTLPEAVNAAGAKATIYLLKDFTVTETVAISEKDITLTLIDGKAVTVKRGEELKNLNVFQVKTGGLLTIDGTDGVKATVDGCGLVSSTLGMSLIQVEDGGTFTLGENAVLKNAKTMSNGGALYVAGDNASAILSGDVTGNRAAYGGAILINNGASVTIKSGKYSDNKANYNDSGQGGVAIIGGKGGKLTVENGEFSGNASKQNGGVFRCSAGTLTIQDGSFCKNSADDDGNNTGHGGVVSIGDGTVTINGGTYSENKAINGGVLHCDAKTTMKINITAGTFNKNQATGDSGGVLYCCGTLSITGGTYSENSAKTYGGMVNISANTKEAKISNAMVYNNSVNSVQGGAFHISAKMTLTLTDCTINDNNRGTSSFPADISVGAGSTLKLNDNNDVGVVLRVNQDTSKVEIQKKFTGKIKLVPVNNVKPTVGDTFVTFAEGLSDTDKQESVKHMTVRFVTKTTVPYEYDDTTYCIDTAGKVQLRENTQ